MQDLVRVRQWHARNEGNHLSDRNFGGRGRGQAHRLSRLGAASTGNTGWGTRAVLLTRPLVTRAGLCNDQAVGAGGAERQQRDDDGEGEPPHLMILALARMPLVSPGPVGDERSDRITVSGSKNRCITQAPEVCKLVRQVATRDWDLPTPSYFG